jgi:hypothetical protein
MKKFIEYLRSFPNVTSENSTKLFALLISALAGAFLAFIVIPFVLIYDVIQNGHIETNLVDLGVFLLCDGAFIFGAGAQVKVHNIIDKKVNKTTVEEE